MKYRICKSFEVESGHMLSKHPGRCRLPHGHTRRIDLVLSSESLDAHDMVCDFKALKLAVVDYLDAFDHAMAVNSEDPEVVRLRESALGGRLVEFDGEDPTTEVMARRIFEHVAGVLAAGGAVRDDRGDEYRLRPGVTLERVRVTETSSSWAEYGV
ncbi:MAG: 6-carboxytetrahydropterin synthase [Planctomycetota bacterium]